MDLKAQYTNQLAYEATRKGTPRPASFLQNILAQAPDLVLPNANLIDAVIRPDKFHRESQEMNRLLFTPEDQLSPEEIKAKRMEMTSVAMGLTGGIKQKLKPMLVEKAKKFSDFTDFLKSHPVSREERRALIKDWKKETGFKDIDSSIDRGTAHSPADPSYGSPAYNVSENGTYPEDIYSSNGLRFYGQPDDKMDRLAYSKLMELDGNPNKMVRVFRATEKDGSKIVPGDWVTTVRDYAKQHGESALNGNYKIESKVVRAKDIFTSGDSLLEYGYHPQGEVKTVRQHLAGVWNEAHK